MKPIETYYEEHAEDKDFYCKCCKDWYSATSSVLSFYGTGLRCDICGNTEVAIDTYNIEAVKRGVEPFYDASSN